MHPAKFALVPRGWRAFDDDFGLLTRHGASVESHALSWRYRPDSFGWANAMPRGAMAVTVILVRRSNDPHANLCRGADGLPFAPIRRLPLRLPKAPNGWLEGSKDVVEYRVFGRIDRSYSVDLRLAVRTIHPTAAMLRRGQAVVSGIRFPRWPRPKRC